MPRPTTCFLVVLALLLGAGAANAFELRPISREFDASGSESTQTYDLVNATDEYAAIEVRFARRAIDLQGNETLTEAEDDFVVFPPQILLDPGGRQTIRVSYIGNAEPENELAYRIIAEQLPIEGLGTPLALERDERGGQVQVLVTYKGSIFVQPKNSKAKLQIVGADGRRSADGKESLELKVSNEGTARTEIRRHQVRIKSEGKTSSWISLSSIKLPAVMPRTERRFEMGWPAGVPFSQKPVVEIRSR